MAGNIDPDFPHYRDCFRMNVTGRLRASALNVDEIACSLSQNTFRNVATAGISGAKDKNSWLFAHSLHHRRELGGSLVANLDFLPNADFLGRGFQTQTIELFERQRGQEF